MEYGKPVVHAVAAGKARRVIPILPPGVASVTARTVARIMPDGKITGTSVTSASGPMGLSLRGYAFGIMSYGPERAAKAQLNAASEEGTGSFEVTTPTLLPQDYSVSGHFELEPRTGILAGESFRPPIGLELLIRPGDVFMGPLAVANLADSESTPCFSGRETQELSLELPDGKRVAQLPKDTRNRQRAHPLSHPLGGDEPPRHRPPRVHFRDRQAALHGSDARRGGGGAQADLRGAARADRSDGPMKGRGRMRRFAGMLALVLVIGLGGCAGGPPSDIAAGARAQRRGDYAEAIRRYTLVLQSPGLAPKTRVMVLDGRSVAYIQAGDRDKAIADAEEAIRLSPDNAYAYNNRGAAYLGKGQYDLAIADLTVSLQLSPDDPTVHLNRGDAYFFKGQYDPALADYDEIVRHKPDSAIGHERRATVLLRRQDYDQAIAEFSRALELQHDLLPALSGRGVAYSHQAQVEKAMADFGNAIRLKSDYVVAFEDRAVYEFALGRFDKSAGRIWSVSSSSGPRVPRPSCSSTSRMAGWARTT